MIDVKVQDWSSSVLAGYGVSLVPGDLEFTYETISGGLQLGNSSSDGFLMCSRREMVLDKMERHVESMEILISLRGDSVLCLSEPSDTTEEDSIFAMLPGIWHWAPYAM